jgi:hypothetical protein
MSTPILTLQVATTLAAAVVIAPPRCNCAGFCDYCGNQGCRSPRCITRYNATWWAICESCDGRGGDGLGSSCPLCTHGVMQVIRGSVGAVQPR